MNFGKLVALAGVFSLVAALPAFAYLDPGTGSMLLQGLIGGAVAAGSIVSLYWQRLKSFFSKSKSTESDAETK